MFELLTARQIEFVINALVVQNFPDGTAIIKEGEQGDLLYIIKEGLVKIDKRREGDEIS